MNGLFVAKPQGVDGSTSGDDDIDWTTDFIGDSEITSDIPYDIHEMLDSIDFIETFTADFDRCYNEFQVETSVGQPICEANDKICLENLLNKNFSLSSVSHPPLKKLKTSGNGPSCRNSKKKSKGLPKRPLSAYNLFFQSERLVILEEAIQNQQRISFENLAKLVGQRWHDLSDEQVEKYRELSQLDIARYRREMKIYHQQSAVVGEDDVTVSLLKMSKTKSPRSPRSTPTTPRKRRRYSDGSSEPPTLCKRKSDVNDRDESIVALPKKQDLSSFEESPLSELKRDSKDCCEDKGSSSNRHLPKKGYDKDVTETNSLPSVLNTPLLHVTKSSVPPPPLIDPQEPQLASISELHDVVPSCVPSQHIGFHTARTSRLSYPSQTPWYTTSRFPSMPTSHLYHIRQPFEGHCRTPPLPTNNEVMIYDRKLGRERPYTIKYKCYAMKRSEAYDYLHRFSRPNYENGSYCISMEQLLHHVPHHRPPGVEVDIPLTSNYPQQPGVQQYHHPTKNYHYQLFSSRLGVRPI
jgi:HMG (high mobility group) box